MQFENYNKWKENFSRLLHIKIGTLTQLIRVKIVKNSDVLTKDNSKVNTHLNLSVI